MIQTRRGFLGVLTGAIAAPLVCKAELLMPVREIKLSHPLEEYTFTRHGITYYFTKERNFIKAVVAVWYPDASDIVQLDTTIAQAIERAA